MNHYKLNSKNLTKVPNNIAIPQYDRTQVKTGIVHVGIGGFHRAHQAYYTDQILHQESSSNWGICGIALLDSDINIYNTLKEQDGLYTLIIKELDGTLTQRVIGSITEYLFAPENPLAVIEKMASPEVKIITLTITEGGYNYNETIDGFDFDNTLIKNDLKNTQTPKTIFGYLTQALKLRKERGLLGCTVQSCDNIQENGQMAKKMLLSYIKVAEPALVAWVESNVSFPNSMVDRITPVTSSSDIDHLRQNSSIDDAWPVVCESFIQWIIEDNFEQGRPNWEKVGAQFVDDVTPYEKMKLSLLNAGHSVLGILGALVGYSTIDQSVQNTAIGSFLSSFMHHEVTPILSDLEGINLDDYKASLLKRFGNIYIKDQIERICSESSAKIPIFIIPTIKAQLKHNSNIERAVFVLAAWAVYSLGVNEAGDALAIKDDLQEILHSKALESQENPKAFLEITSIFGKLKESNQFVDAYIKSYQNIVKYGSEKCVIDLNNRI